MKQWKDDRILGWSGKVVGIFAFLLLLSANSVQVNAATIQGMQLLSESDGQRLNIAMDEAAEYQVFNLEGPTRLVLNFPGAAMAEGVDDIAGAGAVESVYPKRDSSGVRIEIALVKGAKYEIVEKGNDLQVSVTQVSSKPAGQSDGAVLQDITVKDKGNITELILHGRNMDSNHNALVTNGGKTMVVDFWGGSSSLPKEHYTYSAQRLNDVTVGSAEGRMRLVVSLRGGDSSHQIDADSNTMVLRIGQIDAKKSTAGLSVEAVDFQPDDRVAHLVIRTNEANPVVKLNDENGNVTLDIKNASLAPGQERSQDVSAFSGPVKQVDSYAVNRNVRIVARLRQKAEVSSFQNGNVLTLTLTPESLVASGKADAAARDEKAYTGQKVSFNYKDIDIRNALQLIAEMSELNIIMSDDVSGVLTMRLVDVPWDQALDLILQARGLGKEQSGNVIRIAPLGVLKADADARKLAKESAEDVAPLETEFVTLGYASVNDVQTILQGGSVATATTTDGATTTESTGGSGELKLLSSRGSILLDERSNTMIITDTRERLNNIKRLVAVIDKPTQQVLIEARIVEASDTFSRELGVRWGGNATKALNNNYTHNVYGAAGPNAALGGAAGNVVDLAAAGTGLGAVGYTLTKLGGNLNLNLELSAAEQNGDIKVVSSPRVFTSNLVPAKIEQDTQIPFLVTTVSAGGTTTATEMKSSLLSLKVTPQVTADKRIVMELTVNKDTPVPDAAGGPPSIDKKTVETKLLVNNGETVVLGGIYTQTESEQVNGVPLLKDIPLLGYLFKNKTITDNRNELLIFITPTIIGDELSTL
ncbi:type IV pilus secretin family protein [Mariprofundus ferrinatatus]|nr:type IV pilus secretin family protein [Mariprofundus ferrinatatus]